jgi:hypothetical protein
MDEKKIKDKQIVVAWMAWNGKKIKSVEILIISIQREISRKKIRNPMMLLALGYLNVLCNETLEGVVNLATRPLEIKGLEEETNSLDKQLAKASSSSPNSNTPITRFQLQLIEVKEELEILNDKPLEEFGVSDPNAN